MIKAPYTNIDFGVNKIPVEVIKEGAFGTYFRDIYHGINGKWYINSIDPYGWFQCFFR